MQKGVQSSKCDESEKNPKTNHTDNISKLYLTLILKYEFQGNISCLESGFFVKYKLGLPDMEKDHSSG